MRRPGFSVLALSLKSDVAAEHRLGLRLSLQTCKDLGLDHKSEMMVLEPGLQSEVSQKESDKYRILIHVYGT